MADDVTVPDDPQHDVDNNNFATKDSRIRIWGKPLGRLLLDRLKKTPVVNRDTVMHLQQQIREHRLCFNDEQVAQKFLDLEKALNG